MKLLNKLENPGETLAFYRGTHLDHTGDFLYYESTSIDNAINMLATAAATGDPHATDCITKLVAGICQTHSPEGVNRIDVLRNHVMTFDEKANSFTRTPAKGAFALLVPIDTDKSQDVHVAMFTGLLVYMEQIRPVLALLAIVTLVSPDKPEKATTLDPSHPLAILTRNWPSSHAIKPVYAGEGEDLHVHFTQAGKILFTARPCNDTYSITKPEATAFFRSGITEADELLKQIAHI